jgi:cell division protein ZapD
MSLYEQPLNEKMRLFMRLSHLMKRFNNHLETATPENCQAAVMVLLEIYSLSSRLDVKNATLHIMDGLAQSIRENRELEGPERLRLEHLLEKLEKKSKQLYNLSGQLGQHLKSHNFLNILRQRSTIAGGVNGLDIPLFSYWLNLPEKKRVSDLNDWVAPYNIAFGAIELLMEVILENKETQQLTAEGGFYQSSLSPANEYQVLSVELPENVAFYPEISAGKQRFSIRFVDASFLETKGKQNFENIEFTLNLYSY